jgi:hypothetical protein
MHSLIGLTQQIIDLRIVKIPKNTAFNAGSLQGIYGMNFTASANGSELDSIAEFTADGVSNFQQTYRTV